MIDQTPPHRAISGYLGPDFRWHYTVYDRTRFEWVSGGWSRERAEKVAADLPDLSISEEV